MMENFDRMNIRFDKSDARMDQIIKTHTLRVDHLLLEGCVEKLEARIA